MAFLPDGRILIADGLDNHRVMILDKNMNYLGEFGGFGQGPGPVQRRARARASAPSGRIFALDRSGGRINVFKTTADPAKVEFVDAFPGFSLPLDIIVNDDSLWMTDLKPLRFTKLDFQGNHLYTWMVPKDLPDGYLEVHTFTVDSNGNLYGGSHVSPHFFKTAGQFEHDRDRRCRGAVDDGAHYKSLAVGRDIIVPANELCGRHRNLEQGDRDARLERLPARPAPARLIISAHRCPARHVDVEQLSPLRPQPG